MCSINALQEKCCGMVLLYTYRSGVYCVLSRNEKSWHYLWCTFDADLWGLHWTSHIFYHAWSVAWLGCFALLLLGNGVLDQSKQGNGVSIFTQTCSGPPGTSPGASPFRIFIPNSRWVACLCLPPSPLMKLRLRFSPWTCTQVLARMGLAPPSTKPSSSFVQSDLLHLFDEFHAGTLDLDGLNRALLVLLPKKDGSGPRMLSAPSPCRIVQWNSSPRSW